MERKLLRLQELLLIFILAMLPFQLSTHNDSAVAGIHERLGLALVCLVILWRRLQQRKDLVPLELLKLPVVKFYLLYMLLAFCDFFWVKDQKVYLIELTRHICWALMPVYAFSLGPGSVKNLTIGLMLLCVSSTGLSLYTLYELHKTPELLDVHKVAQASVNSVWGAYGKNTIGATAACAFIIGLVYLFSVRSKWVKAALVGSLLINMVFLLKGGSKAFMFASIVFGLIIIFRIKKTRMLFLATAGIGSMVSLIVALFIYGTSAGHSIKHQLDTRYYATNTKSLGTRLVIFQYSVDYLAKNPLGATGWRQLAKYAGTYARAAVPNYDTNIILSAWLDVGPLGALAQAISIIALFVMLFKNQRQLLPGSPLSQINLCLIGFAIAYTTHAMQDTSSPHHDRMMYFATIGMGCFIKLLIDYRRAAFLSERSQSALLLPPSSPAIIARS